MGTPSVSRAARRKLGPGVPVPIYASMYGARRRLFVHPSVTNGEAMVAALGGFGFGSLDIQASDFGCPERVVQIGVPPNRIDLITSIAGVDFDQAWEGRVPGELDGIEARVLLLGFPGQHGIEPSRPRMAPSPNAGRWRSGRVMARGRRCEWRSLSLAHAQGSVRNDSMAG